MWTTRMSQADYETFLCDMLTLQLRYAILRQKQDGLSLAEAVCRLTEIYSYMPFHRMDVAALDSRPMRDLCGQIEACHLQTDPSKWIDQTWRVIWPMLQVCLADDLTRAQAAILQSYAGFSYEFCPEYFGPVEPDWLTLHFRNAMSPASPLDHLPVLRDALLTLIHDATQRRPDVSHVQCASWLNHLPAFTSLFPDAWVSQAQDCPYDPNMGWWGQFVNRFGQVNAKEAHRLLQTGVFQYTNRHARCSLHDWREHLLAWQG